jgi:hypothetical protein
MPLALPGGSLASTRVLRTSGKCPETYFCGAILSSRAPRGEGAIQNMSPADVGSDLAGRVVAGRNVFVKLLSQKR